MIDTKQELSKTFDRILNNPVAVKKLYKIFCEPDLQSDDLDVWISLRNILTAMGIITAAAVLCEDFEDYMINESWSYIGETVTPYDTFYKFDEDEGADIPELQLSSIKLGSDEMAFSMLD